MRLKQKKYKRDLLDIESILQTNLKPVSARPEFIQNLHKGLMDYSFPQPESAVVDLKVFVLFALVGFTGVVFVFSMWVRLIVVIISTLGMIQSSKQNEVVKR